MRPHGFHHFLYRAFDDVAALGRLLIGAVLIFIIATPLILLTGPTVEHVLDAMAAHVRWPALLIGYYASWKVGKSDAPAGVVKRRRIIVWSIVAALVLAAGTHA